MSTKRKAWKAARVAPYVLAAAWVVFFYGVVPWFLTNLATRNRFHFRDPNDAKTPQSYGLAYHPIEFRASDGILLKGWFVPAAGSPEGAKGTIVYAHGLNRTRIEMLPMAAFGHTLGYNGLLFDFRHHGESGGALSTVGYQERRDVEAAVRYALMQEKAARPVVLWGVSMGAAASLMAAAESPDVAAVICDSTFLNFADTVRHHYELFLSMVRRRWWWFPPLPSFPIADEVTHWIAWRGNFSVADFDLEKAVERIGDRPILLVGLDHDRRMPPEIARALYQDARSRRKQLLILPGDRHGEGFTLDPGQYEEAVRGFLASVGTTAQLESSAAPTTPGRTEEVEHRSAITRAHTGLHKAG